MDVFRIIPHTWQSNQTAKSVSSVTLFVLLAVLVPPMPTYAASATPATSFTISGDSQCQPATAHDPGICTDVTIKNTSMSPIDFKTSVQTIPGDFDIDDTPCTTAGAIAAGASCNIKITLRPGASGSTPSVVLVIPTSAGVAGKTFRISTGPNAPPCQIGVGAAQVSGANVLQGFSTTFSSGATLASASILNAYLNQGVFPNTRRCSPFNAMSVQISATAAATSSTFAAYAKAEFLGVRNGLINIYLNPFAGRNASVTALQWNDRDLASDHIYMTNPWTSLSQTPADQISDDQLLGFWLFGLGGRGVKTAQNGTSLEAIGTVYAGFGWDSPMHDVTLSGNSDPSTWGGLSFSAFSTVNVANRGTVEGLFFPPSTITPGHPGIGSTYETIGAAFTIWMPAKLYFRLEYSKGIGSVGRVIGDTAFLTFGYGSSTTATNSDKNARKQ